MSVMLFVAVSELVHGVGLNEISITILFSIIMIWTLQNAKFGTRFRRDFIWKKVDETFNY